MAKIKNTDFFRKPIETGAHQQKQAGPVLPAEADKRLKRHVQLPQLLIDNTRQAASTLNNFGLNALAREIWQYYGKVLDQPFTIAVVGEFSNGKSTLINRLLGRSLLPVGILPTTALLTRISHGYNERMLVIGGNGKMHTELPLKPESWNRLTASNFNDKEPEGHVRIEIHDNWLGQYGIDIIDTPGAGDLEEQRAAVVERCLMGADAAVIVISATKPFSLTEQQFIRQKVMSRQVPFVAVALTQLDLVNIKEREGVVDFLQRKLESLKMSVPLFVADDNIRFSDVRYQSLVGMQRLRNIVTGWLRHPERQQLTERWLTANVARSLEQATQILQQQKTILCSKDNEREQLIAQRNEALFKIKVKWEELRTDMLQRCEKCTVQFEKKAVECGEQIAEALQHEVAHQPNPKEWLENEYAYRAKRELQAVSLTLDGLVARQVAADLRWLNDSLAKQFKEAVSVDVEALMSKDDFRPDVNERSLHLESLKDQSTKATVTSAALTLGAALLLGVTGGAPLILATMGVGTGANIISKKMLEKKGDAQREEVKRLIAQEVPRIVGDASKDSAVKIKIIYNDILREALATERRWMQVQRELISQSVGKPQEEAKAKLDEQIQAIAQLQSLFRI